MHSSCIGVVSLRSSTKAVVVAAGAAAVAAIQTTPPTSNNNFAQPILVMFLDVMANNVMIFQKSSTDTACDYKYKLSPHDFGGPPAKYPFEKSSFLVVYETANSTLYVCSMHIVDAASLAITRSREGDKS